MARDNIDRAAVHAAVGHDIGKSGIPALELLVRGDAEVWRAAMPARGFERQWR